MVDIQVPSPRGWGEVTGCELDNFQNLVYGLGSFFPLHFPFLKT